MEHLCTTHLFIISHPVFQCVHDSFTDREISSFCPVTGKVVQEIQSSRFAQGFYLTQIRELTHHCQVRVSNVFSLSVEFVSVSFFEVTIYSKLAAHLTRVFNCVDVKKGFRYLRNV